jgi:biotin carboxyl carrier protein
MMVTAVGNNVFRVSDGRRSHVAYAVGSAQGVWVFIDGRVHVVEPRQLEGQPRTRDGVPQPSSGPGAAAQRFSTAGRRRTHASADVAAPMPATVRKITVQPGQRVSTGDVLIVLEAMKMELPIKAPRDATVKSLACREGELVPAGVPLLELE